MLTVKFMDKNGILYIVATPIGNLEDMTLRAIRVLGEVDAIACEDTRVTSKLLSHYNIAKPLISLHQHSGKVQFEKVLGKLEEGEDVAYCSDAGTPGISDPGNQLVAKALGREIKVIPIPGVSALGAIVSAAGMDMQKFAFWGFPPHKKGRETFFRHVLAMDVPVVYYDSPHRVLKNIKLMTDLTQDKKIDLVIGRELTKMFEQIVRGEAEKVLAYFEANPEKVKGEFVVIVQTGE